MNVNAMFFGIIHYNNSCQKIRLLLDFLVCHCPDSDSATVKNVNENYNFTPDQYIFLPGSFCCVSLVFQIQITIEGCMLFKRIHFEVD